MESPITLRTYRIPSVRESCPGPCIFLKFIRNNHHNNNDSKSQTEDGRHTRSHSIG